MRMTVVFTAPLLLVSTMSGCADSEPTQSRWQTAGVRVDPFLAEAKLGEAVASATERFHCGTPVHPPNMLPRTAASLECTIADVQAEVFLLDEGRGISANIHPRE